MTKATLDVEETSSSHTMDKEGFEEEGGGGKEQRTPFKITKCQKEMTSGPNEKQKSDKHIHVDPMVLTKGELDEIRDKVHVTTTKLCIKFQQQYQQGLGSSQKDLRNLQIYTCQLQASVG